MRHSLAAYRQLLLLVALMSTCVAVLFPYRHFAGDDAHITFRFVRNLANGLGYSFNPGEPTYGSTAPSWVFLLVATHKIGLSIEAGAHALNWICAVSCVTLMWLWTADFIKSNTFRFLAVLLLILDPWFVRWSLSGMENGLALALLLAALLASNRYRNCGRVDWVTPIFLGFASLTRPEMVLLTGLVGLDALLRERKRLTANVLVLVVVFATIVIPWLVYAEATFGTVIPNTISSKISRNYGAALIGCFKYVGSFWPMQALSLLWLCVSTRTRAGLAAAFRTPTHWTLPVTWAIALPVFYVVGGAPVSGRYLMYAAPSLLLIGAKSWSILWEQWRGPVIAAVVGTIGLVVGVQYKYCWYVTRWPLGMDPRFIDLARVAQVRSNPGDIVACDQIGVMGYYSNLYILDIVGLVSPEVLQYKNATDPNEIWRYLHQRGARFLFLIDDEALLRSRDGVYESVELIAQSPIQREGAGAAGTETTYYLYDTHWSEPTRHLPKERRH